MEKGFDAVNSFLIDKSIIGHEFKRYLFFDLHVHDNFLTIVGTFYPDIVVNLKDVVIHQEDQGEWKRLKLYREWRRNLYEPIRIVKYKLQSIQPKENYHVKVAYRGQEAVYNLKADTPIAQPAALATLFLFDFNRVERWLAHHRQKGFDHFYLFYRGKMPIEVRNVLEPLRDVTVCDWNFPFWAEGVVVDKDDQPTPEWKLPLRRFAPKDMWHHAQISFMNNILVKYGHRHEWLGFIDLDEMIMPIKTQKVDLGSYSPKISAVIMPSYWTIDKDPESGNIVRNKENCGTARTKFLIRPNNTFMVNVHHPYKFKGRKISIKNSDLCIYHLIDPTNFRRTGLVTNPVEDCLN